VSVTESAIVPVESRRDRGAGPRRRVLMIAYEFPPSSETGAQSCVQIARYLPLYGWEPVVLTVQPRYFEHVQAWPEHEFPGRIVRTRALPHVLSIYKSLKSRVRPHRDPRGGRGESSDTVGRFRRRILALLQTPDAYTGWIVPGLISALKTIRRERVDYLLSSGPYWTNHLIGLALARLTGLPWAAHFRDPWVQGHSMLRASAWASRIDTALERMVILGADVVACVTESHTRLLRQAYGLSADKCVTIPNGYDETEWEAVAGPAPDGDRPPTEPFVITYAGSLYLQRTPAPLFRALRALTDAGDLDRNRVRVDLIGDCAVAEGRPVAELAREYGLAACVRLLGRLSRRDTLRHVARADLLLILAENLTIQIPAKTYEYLRAGRPILALTSEGALADIVRRTNAGWVADPVDGAGVAAAVHDAYRRWSDGLPGPRVDPAVVAAFDRRRLAGRFAEMFERSPA
jgi:glycosyltransferase involved in cell wall biosynthesis